MTGRHNVVAIVETSDGIHMAEQQISLDRARNPSDTVLQVVPSKVGGLAIDGTGGLHQTLAEGYVLQSRPVKKNLTRSWI